MQTANSFLLQWNCSFYKIFSIIPGSINQVALHIKRFSSRIDFSFFGYLAYLIHYNSPPDCKNFVNQRDIIYAEPTSAAPHNARK